MERLFYIFKRSPCHLLLCSNPKPAITLANDWYLCILRAFNTPCRASGSGYIRNGIVRNGLRQARGRYKLAYYESVFIARQDITATQVEGLTETFSELIKEQGGSVASTENWGLRSLAYRIKKNRKGHYVMMNIDAPAGAIHEMERQMRINEDILRYLTIKVDAFEEGPSIMMQNKSREDRPRRQGGDDRPPRFNDSAPAPTAAPVEAEASEGEEA